MSPRTLSSRPPAVPAAVAPAGSEEPHPVAVLPFLVVHASALGALFVEFRWSYVGLAALLYYVRMFGVTAGYHRYFSHRSYRTSRVFQFVLAWLAQTSAQKGVLWWAAHHRDHHRYSDRPEDLHSPVQRGLWWAHLGWILSPASGETRLARVPDLAGYAELRWLNRWHLLPAASLAGVLYLAGGLPVLIWGFCVSTVVLWHGTFCINSLAHRFGRRRYATRDESRNSLLLALLTCGEGWHNNHHHYMSSANQGFFWWEVDLTWYVLKALSWTGLVWDLRTPPPRVLLARGRAPGRPPRVPGEA